MTLEFAQHNDTIVVCADVPNGEFYFYWEYSVDNGTTWDSLQIGADATYDHFGMDYPCPPMRYILYP
ncbi:MAG: hypothetical protein R2788_26065 [Saprospiraceae bacterium]